mgnify:CR=1 FL=1
MSGFQLQRLEMLIEPEPGNPLEVEGVLNPAATRGPDGQLYLFPRLVAKGNYSRIGIARVKFDEAGDPCGVERLGIALEPEADYERLPDGGGGCEDARVTFVEPLQCYVMTGLAIFEPFQGIDFVHVDNKDASIFPVSIPNHAGKKQLALIHRPLFPGTRPEEIVCQSKSCLVDREHESIWISYCPTPPNSFAAHEPGLFNSHHRLATPVASWEQLKIGGGTPPIMCRHGWLVIYHGVSKSVEPEKDGRQLCYSAGVMVLSKTHPQTILYRSPEPVLTPESAEELRGTVANVVFPTGIDRRDDLGTPDRFDVYYGMADNRIGVARLDLPEHLPSGALADGPNQN